MTEKTWFQQYFFPFCVSCTRDRYWTAEYDFVPWWKRGDYVIVENALE